MFFFLFSGILLLLVGLLGSVFVKRGNSGNSKFSGDARGGYSLVATEMTRPAVRLTRRRGGDDTTTVSDTWESWEPRDGPVPVISPRGGSLGVGGRDVKEGKDGQEAVNERKQDEDEDEDEEDGTPTRIDAWDEEDGDRVTFLPRTSCVCMCVCRCVCLSIV